MKVWAAALAVTIVASGASAQATVDDQRKLYALGKAGVEYCPQIENPWFALAAIGYDMNADGEWQRFKAAEDEWFATFRSAGRRDDVCELLMRQYGPGAKFQMFQDK